VVSHQDRADALSSISCSARIDGKSSPYAKLLTDYVPQFEEATGAKVNYETPSNRRRRTALPDWRR
jgi:hypothetical protein